MCLLKHIAKIYFFFCRYIRFKMKVDMGEGKLPIKEFKLSDMVANPSIVMIAKRGSGKSVVCKAILNHFKDIPCGMIIAPTDINNHFYGSFFPETYIHYEYKSSIIEKLLARQTSIKEKKEKRKNKKIDTRAFVVMDDCLSQKKSWVKDQPILELLYNGRHFDIMYILTMQYPLGITPELRANFDYIFLLAEDFVSNLKRIYEHYAGMFPDFNSFRQTFQQLTADYGCMVIANRGARATFLDKIYWYKANYDESTKIDMGCKQFRKFHQDNYDPRWRTKKRAFNIDEICSKRKRDKSEIKVDKVQIDENGKEIEKKNRKH